MSSDERVQVAVVGAGIAGLALAYRLAQRGIGVRVVEGAARAGGNIQSELRAGYRCEWGPNGFLDNEPATLRLADDLGLRDQLAPASPLAGTRWIVRGGKLRVLPTKPQAFLTSDVLSVAGRARVMLEWAQPAAKSGDDESVWDFARRRIGREAADVLVDAMVTGVYAGDPRRLSLEAAFPRMRTMEREHGSLLRALRAAKRDGKTGASPMGPAGTLTSFRDGMETLVHALAQSLGTRLTLARRLASLRPERCKRYSVSVACNAGGCSASARSRTSSAPLQQRRVHGDGLSCATSSTKSCAASISPKCSATRRLASTASPSLSAIPIVSRSASTVAASTTRTPPNWPRCVASLSAKARAATPAETGTTPMVTGRDARTRSGSARRCSMIWRMITVDSCGLVASKRLNCALPRRTRTQSRMVTTVARRG